ncbi:MAG: hypothetical protein WCV90_01105 [Candidatus Woesearchaeota archaeon]|jgi:nicotinic acid mononucleotide adenylyltransferase
MNFNLNVGEVARSIELYNLGIQLQEEAKKGNPILEFTREPFIRKREDVRRIVVAFGSYDPLSVAHEALFLHGLQASKKSIPFQSGLDELLIVTTTHHFEKGVDLQKNSAIYDRIHAQEGFASCTGKVSLAFFNYPMFVDLLPAVEQSYPNASVYFVVGADVLEKIVSVPENEKRGKDTAQILSQLFRQYFIVSEREVTYKDRPPRILTAQLLLEENPLLQPYASRIIPITLDQEYPELEIPIEEVSSSLIRAKRSRGEEVHHLEAVGISEFVDKRGLYLQDNRSYEAFVSARQMYADHFRPLNASIGEYIEPLMGLLSEMESSKDLQDKVIAAYKDKIYLPTGGPL